MLGSVANLERGTRRISTPTYNLEILQSLRLQATAWTVTKQNDGGYLLLSPEAYLVNFLLCGFQVMDNHVGILPPVGGAGVGIVGCWPASPVRCVEGCQLARLGCGNDR